SLHANSCQPSTAVEAATFNLALRSSCRAVFGRPEPFTDRKRAFCLIPSSPTRATTRDAGTPAPQQAKAARSVHANRPTAAESPHKCNKRGVKKILQRKL